MPRSPTYCSVAASLAFVLSTLGGGCGNSTKTNASNAGLMGAIDKKHGGPLPSSTVAHDNKSKSGSPPVSALGTKAKKTARDRTKPSLSVAKPPDDAVSTTSGMFYKQLSAPTGERKLAVNDTALVHYSAWHTSGELVYSTASRGKPQPMAAMTMSSGWKEALFDMSVGERRMYWMPASQMSAGAQAGAPIVVFEIELVDVERGPETPKHLDAPPPDAEVTNSGVAYRIVQPGTGTETPENWDELTVHFTIWSQDGVIRDNTRIRDRPRTVRLFQESKGLADAIRLMVVGQKNRVWLTEEQRAPLKPGDPGGLQILDIHLVSRTGLPSPPPVPADVSGPPATAQQTADGVYYVVLQPGTGTEQPKPSGRVRVHYTGWTTDGKMFDSSVVRGTPATFPLQGVIAGWTDVLQVMVVGQKIRTWIPENLAYQGKPGRPAGMLVFEIELLGIDP